jgi:2-polyprenyl-3-methyl-5-hydroxy-6-metoxy-1,4-benzoquinol methylase
MPDLSQQILWAACPICQSARRSVCVSFEQLEFVRCLECTGIYKSRELVGMREATFYDSSYFHGRKSGRDKRFEHRVRKSMRAVAAALVFTKAQSLLDVGCSLGYGIEAGRRLGLVSAGMDVSQYAVSHCHERGLKAEIGTMEHMPWKDGEFDIVVMRHVLEHTPTPQEALAEVRRIMTSAGALIIAVPDLAYWKGIFFKRRYRYYRPDDLGQQHYVYYSPKSLCHLLTTAGFKVLAQNGSSIKKILALLHVNHEILFIAQKT